MKISVLTNASVLLEQLQLIELAGRTCYQSYRDPITLESARRFIFMLLRRGHDSVIEHSAMTVRFSDVSRGLTHELVRHRLCAFSQESTRYVDEKETGCVLAPSMQGDQEAHAMAQQHLTDYRRLREKGYKSEDARQLLPIGMENEIVVTANFREWRHIVKQRTQKAAHWEIREAVVRLVTEVREVLSPLFDEFQFINRCPSGVLYLDSSVGLTFSKPEMELIKKLADSDSGHYQGFEHRLSSREFQEFCLKLPLIGYDPMDYFKVSPDGEILG